MKTYLLVSIDTHTQNAEVVRVSDEKAIPVEDSLGMTVVAAIAMPDDITWCLNADLEQSKGEDYPPPMLVVPAHEADRAAAPRPIGERMH